MTAVAQKAEALPMGRKRRNEPGKLLSFRCPNSLREYLDSRPDTQTDTICDALELKRDLEKSLEELNTELIRAAAELGKEYSDAQAETLAHVIKRCLKAKK